MPAWSTSTPLPPNVPLLTNAHAPAGSTIKYTLGNGAGATQTLTPGKRVVLPAEHADILLGTQITGDDGNLYAPFSYNAAASRYRDFGMLPTQPDGYWALNGGLLGFDWSGNARDLAAAGGVTLGGFSSSPTDETKSTDFDDVDDRLTSAYAPYVVGSARTFAGWANRDTAAANDLLISSSGTTGIREPELRLSAANDVVWYVTNGSGSPVVWFGGWPGTGQWVHWALTVNDPTDATSLYINGALVSTQTETETYDATPGNFQVGARGAGTLPFDGKMAHIAVWTRILTAYEIRSLYLAATP